MNAYVPPVQPLQTYSQGFWYAVIAAVLYLFCSVILMINMLGYALGHYTQHFELSDEQQTLILQTMMFFVWLAVGGAIFSNTCGWSFTDGILLRCRLFERVGLMASSALFLRCHHPHDWLWRLLCPQ
jgi:potassium channel subfamily K, other eukaryote